MHRIIQYSSKTSSTQKTETKERRQKNLNMEQPQLFAIRGICRIQIWNVFQVTTPLYTTLNIEGKNDFIESKFLATKNKKDMKPQKKNKTSKHASDDSFFFKNRFYKMTETQERREKYSNKKISTTGKCLRTQSYVLFSFGKCFRLQPSFKSH